MSETQIIEEAEPGTVGRTSGSSIDEIIALYERDVDRTLLRENLKLTVEQRIRQLMNMQRFYEEARGAREESR